MRQEDSVSEILRIRSREAYERNGGEMLPDSEGNHSIPRVRRKKVRKRLYVMLFIFFTLITSITHVRLYNIYDSPLYRVQRWRVGWNPFGPDKPVIITDQQRADELGVSIEDYYIADNVLRKFMGQLEESRLGPLDWGITVPFGDYTLQFHYRIFLNMAISAILAWAFYMRARDRVAGEVIDGQNRQLRDLNRELRGKISQVEKYTRELEQAQSKLVQAQKLASIGRLSATLAHEIRNPMSIIMSAAGIAADDLPAGSPPGQAVNLIRQEISRLDHIITELLNFARPKPPRLDIHNLNELVRNWLHPLSEELAKHGVKLEAEVNGQEHEVLADADQLYQVFLNVVWNARDAAKEDGEGTVHVWIEDAVDGMVELNVRDDGPGIDEETLQQIFEPFFTTKTSGSGLGLPVVQQLTEGMGGSVEIESELERGTTVRLRLSSAAPIFTHEDNSEQESEKPDVSEIPASDR